MGGGGKGKGGGGTPPPDFSSAAMVNQQGPAGGVSWNRGPGGQVSMNTSFAPGMQGAWNNVTQGMAQGGAFNPAQASQQAFDRVYGAYQSRLDPTWKANRAEFDAKMANAGISPGSEAFTNASADFNYGMNDAYNQAIGQAVGLSQAEQGQARQNAMLPFMQGNAMMNMLPKGDAGAPLEAARDQYTAQRAYDAQNQNGKGGLLGGLGSIAGTAFGGPLGTMLGGAAGNALGSLFGGKGGEPAPDYNPYASNFGPTYDNTGP